MELKAELRTLASDLRDAADELERAAQAAELWRVEKVAERLEDLVRNSSTKR